MDTSLPDGSTVKQNGYTIIAAPKISTASQSAPLEGKYLEESFTPAESLCHKAPSRRRSSIDELRTKPRPIFYRSLRILKQKSSLENTSGNYIKSLFKSVSGNLKQKSHENTTWKETMTEEEESQRIRSYTSLQKSNYEHLKPRKISTPEFRQQPGMNRRMSLESSEVVKSDRVRAILERKVASSTRLANRDFDSELDINENETKVHTSKARSIFNSFRKKSLRRSKTMSIAEADNEKNEKNNASNRISTDADLIYRERDRAIDEWGKSASKCEELIEELEHTLSELMFIKSERDEKEEEIERLMFRYETDVDDRDSLIERLREELNTISQQLDVAKTERTEAYDQRDELLQHSYISTQTTENLRTAAEELQEENDNLKEQCLSLEEQISYIRTDRDHALQLWNTTVDERKKLHDEHISLTSSRDESLRKAFHHIEEINSLRAERDQFRRDLENVKRCIEKNGDIHNQCGCLSRYDSGCSAASIGKDIAKSALEEEMLASARNEYTMSSSEESEDVAICIDTLDSRLGLKLDDAIDTPHVMVTFVTSQLEEKWNIKKYDRIISVNGVSVTRADKKTVERLIRDTVGRTISLVLRREKRACDQADIDIIIGKQSQDLGLNVLLQLCNMTSQANTSAVNKLMIGDIITKINSQNISEIISMMMKKISKRTNGKLTLRIKRTGGFTYDQIHKGKIVTSSKSVEVRRRSVTTSELSTPRSIFSDISSLFSSGTDMHVISDAKSIVSKNNRDAIVSSSNGSRKKLIVPDITVSKLSASELKTSQKIRPKSLALLRNNTQMTGAVDTNDEIIINVTTDDPARLVQQSPRPSPRLLRSVTTVERRRKTNLLGPNLSTDSYNDIRFSSSADYVVDSVDSVYNLKHNLPGYATLPRRYRRRTNSDEKTSSTRVLRMEKRPNDAIGFTICGGNKIGIFVKELCPGSVAELSGLKVGDRILHLNSSDLTKATLDFATRVMLNHRSCIQFRIEVKNYANFEELLTKKPLESLYVRCILPHTSTKTKELSFVIGDIFHITDTLYNYNKDALSWSWYGERKKSSVTTEGVLPRIEVYVEERKPITPLPENLEERRIDERSSKKIRRLSKSAQDFKKWLSRKPSFKKEDKKKKPSRKESRTFSFNDLRKKIFYEVLLEPVSV